MVDVEKENFSLVGEEEVEEGAGLGQCEEGSVDGYVVSHTTGLNKEMLNLQEDVELNLFDVLPSSKVVFGY